MRPGPDLDAVGRDPHRVEDIWQLVYQNAYWRNGPVLNNALSGVDQAFGQFRHRLTAPSA